MLSEHVCTNYAFLPKMMHIMLATLYTANALCHNECKSSIQKKGKKVQSVTPNEQITPRLNVSC